MMYTKIWTVEDVVNAITQGNSHLDIVVSNYFRTFIERLGGYEINLQSLSSVDDLNQKIIEGITQLEELRKEFLSVIEIFASSNHT